jgi:F-box domain
MEQLDSPLDTLPSNRKSKLWDRIKRKNASSPNLHKVGIKNWSTRSLPRISSFGSSSSIGFTNGHSRKSSVATAVSGMFDVSYEQPKKQRVVKDFFSSLPNEVKLQILSYLPVKSIAKASIVFPSQKF